MLFKCFAFLKKKARNRFCTVVLYHIILLFPRSKIVESKGYEHFYFYF